MHLPAALCKMQRKRHEKRWIFKSTWMTLPGSHPTSGFGPARSAKGFWHKKRRIVQNDAAKTKISPVDIPTGWDPRTKQQRRVALADFSAAPWRALKNQNAAPTAPPCFSHWLRSSPLHWADCLPLPAAGPCCSNPSRSQSQRVTYVHTKRKAAALKLHCC